MGMVDFFFLYILSNFRLIRQVCEGLIFTFSLRQSAGLVSHPLSTTLLGCKKDELCMSAKRRVIPLSAPLRSIRWARKARAKSIFTNVRWADQSCAKRTSTNKATYLSLKLDLEREFGHFLEELLHVFSSRERGPNSREFESFCCVKICRDQSWKMKSSWERELSLWVIERS